MAKRHTSNEIQFILDLIDEAYEKKAWHGTNLKGSIRRLDPAVAAFRPAAGRHNIWEIVVHAAYWKYAVWRRLTGEKRGSFPLKGSNWFQRPQETSLVAWRGDVKLLDETHRALREVIVSFDPALIPRTPAGSKVSNAAILRGIASHDVYHAGQIQLLKRLAGE